jgi:hypothetical protein
VQSLSLQQASFRMQAPLQSLYPLRHVFEQLLDWHAKFPGQSVSLQQPLSGMHWPLQGLVLPAHDHWHL